MNHWSAAGGGASSGTIIITSIIDHQRHEGERAPRYPSFRSQISCPAAPFRVCVFIFLYTHTHTHTYIYINTFLYIFRFVRLPVPLFFFLLLLLTQSWDPLSGPYCILIAATESFFGFFFTEDRAFNRCFWVTDFGASPSPSPELY